MEKKIMSDYSLYCTEVQTKKALKLGAPIGKICFALDEEWQYKTPTDEQMIGWLEEQGFYFRIETTGGSVEIDAKCIVETHNSTRKEATLAAIDAALDYLLTNK